MSDFSLPKQQRLYKRSDIDALFAKGNRGYAHPFKYCFLLRESTQPPSILVSIPKKLHKRAVRRNLLKRRTKESYRQAKHLLSDILFDKGLSADIAFIYNTKDILDYKAIDNAVRKILETIAKRS